MDAAGALDFYRYGLSAVDRVNRSVQKALRDAYPRH
jgi:hypothetical protein